MKNIIKKNKTKDYIIITCTPETSDPARTPERVSTPKKIPTIKGVSMTRAPGGIISFIEASVEILTQVA